MRRRKRRHLKIQMKFCFVIVMLCISLMLFNHAIDNLFANVTKDQIHNIGTRILNQSVTQLLEDESVSPDQMVEIRYQDNQSISSISVNAEQVNLVPVSYTHLQPILWKTVLFLDWFGLTYRIWG